MPAVRMYDGKQYQKAIEALTELGGTWSGVGFDEKYLLVNETQYAALLRAGVVRDDSNKGKRIGKAKDKRS